MCNFAPPDMVGHTGKYEPAVIACAATGKCMREKDQWSLVIAVTVKKQLAVLVIAAAAALVVVKLVVSKG